MSKPKCYRCSTDAEQECSCGNYFCPNHGEVDFTGDATCNDCLEEAERQQEIQDSIEDEEYMT